MSFQNKIIFLLLTLLVPLCQLFSQNYDLIVKSNGDSIACRIDSITDSHIYFEMLNRGHWIHTNTQRNDVIEYKQNVIQKKTVAFKPHTSYILSTNETAVSIRSMPKNSVYVGILSLNYSRMIPGNNIGFTLAAGLSFVPVLFEESPGIMIETTLLIGGTKHFFEPGIVGYFDSENFAPMIRVDYRFQGVEGFLFRAGILFSYLDDFIVAPALSIGYSF